MLKLSDIYSFDKIKVCLEENFKIKFLYYGISEPKESQF